MKTSSVSESALKAARPLRPAWRVALAGGVMGGATALAVLIGNTYTLDIPQLSPNRDEVSAPTKALAPSLPPVTRATWHPDASHVETASPGGARVAPPHGGMLIAAVLQSVQDVQEAAQAAGDAPGSTDAADAPGLLIPTSAHVGGSDVSLADGVFGFGAANSGGFGPASAGGGLLSGASGPGAGPQPLAADAPQGFQPLLSAPILTGPAPEPATWALMALGLAGVGVALRRQHHAA
jgi:hypothetical protein